MLNRMSLQNVQIAHQQTPRNGCYSFPNEPKGKGRPSSKIHSPTQVLYKGASNLKVHRIALKALSLASPPKLMQLMFRGMIGANERIRINRHTNLTPLIIDSISPMLRDQRKLLFYHVDPREGCVSQNTIKGPLLSWLVSECSFHVGVKWSPLIQKGAWQNLREINVFSRIKRQQYPTFCHHSSAEPSCQVRIALAQWEFAFQRSQENLPTLELISKEAKT